MLRLSRLLRDHSESDDVFDELIKTAGTEIAKASRRFCRKAMTSVIVSVNNKTVLHRGLSQVGVAADVFAESVGDLKNSTNRPMAAPLHARDTNTIDARKLESIRDLLGRSTQLGVRSRRGCLVRVAFHIPNVVLILQ